MRPIVTLPKPESPGPGLTGYVFPIHERQAPFGLIIFSVEPGAGTEAHSHAIREYWLITGGTGELLYDGQRYEVGQGDLLYFEPHKTHRIINTGERPLEVVSVDWHGTAEGA